MLGLRFVAIHCSIGFVTCVARHEIGGTRSLETHLIVEQPIEGQCGIAFVAELLEEPAELLAAHRGHAGPNGGKR